MSGTAFKLLMVIFICIVSNLGFAQDSAIDIFIEENLSTTFDCPDPENFSQLEKYIVLDTNSEYQHLALSVEKAHFLLCEGKTEEAHALLFSVLDKLAKDRSSYLYAYALFDIGYGYDTLEQQQRCEYYEQAKALSSPKLHSDIFLSASLGLITNCEEDNSVTDRLSNIFFMLQTYSKTDNAGAIAHIHNHIGLVYGTELDQYAMAAEQYLMAHEIGLSVYTGSNQLSILVSAITAQLACGQFEKAYQSIIEFERINRNVGTPLTNFYYYYSLASYYYRIDDIEHLKQVLPDLLSYAKPIENSFIQHLVAWYAVVPCVYEEDITCIREYLSEFNDYPFRDNQLFYGLRLRMHVLLDDKEQTLKSIDKFEKVAARRYYKSQDSAGILGVANLYSEIEKLESEIESGRILRQRLVIGSAVFIVFIFGLLAYTLRKKHLEQLAIDPVTQLLNSRTAISRIAKINAPEAGRTNALAIFDLDNFRELNIALGSTSSEHVLREIAKSLQNVTRLTDIVGRFAPEQFVLCLHNIEEQSAIQFFNRVQKELNNTVFKETENSSISVHSSMSIFTTTERFSDLKTIFEEMLMSMTIQSKSNNI